MGIDVKVLLSWTSLTEQELKEGLSLLDRRKRGLFNQRDCVVHHAVITMKSLSQDLSQNHKLLDLTLYYLAIISSDSDCVEADAIGNKVILVIHQAPFKDWSSD